MRRRDQKRARAIAPNMLCWFGRDRVRARQKVGPGEWKVEFVDHIGWAVAGTARLRPIVESGR